MSVSIQRIPGRTVSKQREHVASWEVFDDADYLLGHIDDIGEVGNSTLVFQPTPDSQGYTLNQLERMADALRMAKIARKQESSNDGTLGNRNRLTDTVVLSDVPLVTLSR